MISNPRNPSPRRTRLRSLAVLALLTLAGCTRYPQVDFENLEYVAAIRTACSAQNPEWLAQTAAAIEKARTDGTMSDDEYAACRAIIAQAEAGDWKAAEMECFRFQQDQLAR